MNVGDIVKVKLPRDQRLYRAKILSIGGNCSFHVLCIDFGNNEVVQSSDVFELSDKLNEKVRRITLISVLYTCFVLFN